MRPKKLCLCAWGPYPDKEEVDFTEFDDRGIFLITGATGAGKTTIFDAISYALYGSLSGEERDKERNSVRSDFAEAQTPTYVELIMEHGGQMYRIKRNPECFRPKKRKSTSTASESTASQLTKEKENAILYYPDGHVLEGVREVNGALREVLGLDYQQFKKISMIAQGEFARLLVAPPKEKTKIFREIFGTGVFEKFTQGLGVRSRKLYARVMEHKAKLAEDIRLLSVDIRMNGWAEATGQRFEEIVGGENWNYEELADCLKQMEKEAAEAVCLQKKRYENADKEVENQTAELSAQEQINRNLEQLQKVSAEMKHLQEQAEEYKEKERKLANARNAGFVEGTEERKKQLEEQLAFNDKEKERTAAEKKVILAEEAKLAGLVGKAEKLRELLEQKRALKELRAEAKRLQEEYAEKISELQEGQEKYLKEESAYQRAKEAFEEAEHRRRLAAIGLAAALLERGKPCPVCGSLEHPAPAKAEEGIVSEEELKSLKATMEAGNRIVNHLHEGLVAQKIQVESLEKQSKQAVEKVTEREALLSEETDPIVVKYLRMEPEQALIDLQSSCERAGQIAVLLQEKTAYERRLLLQSKQLTSDWKETEQLLEQLLQQYGFTDRKAYEQAKCSAGELELLQKEITAYQRNLAANREIYIHLQNATKGKVYIDLQEKQNMLQEARRVRNDVLKVQKRWEQNLSEVKKTAKLMKEKLGFIEEDSREYGYIRDLENMAVGNNEKKLVFEQFVLAGYFEEILCAANIRFRKMTSGRYEMERVSEVNDGRVKDNLEIQVLDYYTGRYRSVRTLSGGESFKASLALALGMSDVIQYMNGGIRVDTLFVDEGFGALDEESLNQACDTLMALVEKNRLIGIISHVPELRERIPRQLIIDKTGSGSTIRNCV